MHVEFRYFAANCSTKKRGGKRRRTSDAASNFRQCQKSARRMIIGIGTPSSQSRIPLPMIISPYVVRGVRTRSFQVPSRSEPPSVAARLAEKAPKRNAAVSQKEKCAAFLLALSASVFASVTTASTRFSASAWLMPVRPAMTCATYVLSPAVKSSLRQSTLHRRKTSERCALPWLALSVWEVGLGVEVCADG